jgi:hypothetical protein
MGDNDKNGARDASLMLKIRADALAGNLNKVKDFLLRAPNRREAIERLEGELIQLIQLTRDIDLSVYSAKAEVEGEDRPYLPATLPELQARVAELQKKCSDIELAMTALLAKTNSAKGKVMTAINAAAEMKRSCFHIRPDEPVGMVLSKDLTARISDPVKGLAELNKALAGNVPDVEAWKKFRVASLRSQDIFAEYLDFLGGLALRDIGFDEGISRISEDLIRTYKTNQPPSYPWLALPAARPDTVAKTLARIVRVGFPEWTVWALPFTAHAFWHVIARDDLEDVVLQETALEAIPERLQTCLADAFATYTMGPAYAYAAFYLLLNPLDAFAANPANPADTAGLRVGDDTRAQAILAMLVSMDDTNADNEYKTIALSLGGMWAAAMEQAAAGQRTAQTASDNASVALLVGALWNVLGKCQCASFPSSHWDQMETLEQVLVDRPLQILELRSVLNSMWKARVDPATKDVKSIEDKVRNRIMKKKEIGQGAAQSPNLPAKVTA